MIHSDFSNFMVSSSKLSLLSTVSSTTNSHVLNVVPHVESKQKNLDVHQYHPSISHPSWKKSKWRDKSCFKRPPWSPPPSCPCCPQCRRPPTHMYLILSDMLKVSLMSSPITTAYQILVEENFNWSDTSYCQRPPWSSCPCCPCWPKCRWPPTHVSKK